MNFNIEIVPFEEKWAPYFKSLNVAWLQKYFYVEPVDEEMFSNPKAYILDKGGYIFFAKIGEEVAGTFALLKNEDHSFELGKMAVAEQFQGNGVGNALMEKCIEKARRLGAERVILYSNTILQPAIHLYHKYGFREVPLGDTEYRRSNIKMEKIL